MRGKPSLLLAAFLLLAGTAYADSIEDKSLGTVMLRYVNCSPRGVATIYLDGVQLGTVYTGQYNLELKPDYTPPTPDDEGWDVYDAADYDQYGRLIVGTFCADVRQYAPTGTTWRLYHVYMPEDGPLCGPATDPNPDAMGARADDLRRLFSNNFGVWEDGINDDNEAAAFALATWEIIFETTGTYKVSSGEGRFYTTSTAGFVGLANQWLNELPNGSTDVNLRILVNEDKQDYAVVVSGDGDEPIPEPLTMLSVCLGLGALGRYARRRRTA